jgi:hypothetical protein
MVRIKYRYLLCEILTEDNREQLDDDFFSKIKLSEKIKEIVEENYGVIGLSKIN